MVIMHIYDGKYIISIDILTLIGSIMFIFGGIKMKFKRWSIIFLAFFAIVLSVGAVSASEDALAELGTPESNIDSDVVSADADVVPKTQNVVNADVKKTSEVTSKPKIKTKVEADQVAVAYKKKGYLKIKVEDRYDDDIPIEHVKLKVKVGRGSKAKTFDVKTNSYGVAKVYTKSLKVGNHKVLIKSADERYEISKTSKIFVGKQHIVTLKSSAKKTLKNRDVIKLRFINDYDEKEVKVVLKKAKHTKILKAKFYLKNKYTGKRVVKTDRCEWDDGKWELPDEDYPTRYSLVKVKVYYISTK